MYNGNYLDVWQLWQQLGQAVVGLEGGKWPCRPPDAKRMAPTSMITNWTAGIYQQQL